MNLEVTTAELAIGCAFMGGQIAILASVVRSNRSQGRRLGNLEKWRTGIKAVREDRRRRIADTRGIPVISADATNDDSDETE